MLVSFSITLISTILALYYFSPSIALVVLLAIGAYYIIDTAKTY